MTSPVKFYKYVGAGNDFVILEDWGGELDLSTSQIKSICDRRFGIGADGVLMLESHPEADFKMKYFNADGSRGEMCGNGARCLVRFADHKQRARTEGAFSADDGLHKYKISEAEIDVEILVGGELKDWDIPREGCGFIDTGVPHLVIPVPDAETFDLEPLGRQMNSHDAHPQGINVNIVEKESGSVKVRTWERGVNMETLACGTGAAASAIFAADKWAFKWPIRLTFPGGILEVDHRGNQYWLKGPAELVFEGHLSLSRLHRN